jgi:ATP-dependent protease HslVU (ClpYQ) peptidase subunit
MTVIVLNSDVDMVVLAADRQWTDDTDLLIYQTKIQHISKGTKTIGAIATSGDGKKGLAFEAKVIVAFKQAAPGKDPIEILTEVCDATDPQSIPDSLLVVRGRGYHIDEDGLILEKTRWAIGSGGMVAIGAMWTRTGTAERLATFGCKAAIELTAHCGGPVDVFSMPRPKEA